MNPLTDCPYCHGNFTSTDEGSIPHLLYCSHSVCYKDLTSLSQATEVSSSVNCPVCQTMIDFSYYPDSFPPRNTALIDYLSTVPVETPVASSYQLSLICGNCQLLSASISCSVCSNNLCQSCDFQVHSIPMFAKHQRNPLLTGNGAHSSPFLLSPISSSLHYVNHTPSPGSPPKFCSFHPNEPFKFYCEEAGCRVVICSDCAFQTHRKHSVVRIEEAYEKLKQVVQGKELKKCQFSINLLQQSFDKIVSTEKENHLFLQSNEQNIKNDFQKIFLALKHLEQRIINNLHNETAEITKDIITQKIISSEFFNEVFYFEKKLNHSLSSMDKVDFLSCCAELMINANQLTSKIDGYLEQAIPPSSLSLYGVFPVTNTVGDESLVSQLNSFNLVTDIEDENSASQILASGKEGDSLGVGYIASTFLSTVVTVEQSLHFYNKLVVSSLLELDPKEVHHFSSVIIKAGGVLSIKGWDGSTSYSGILSLLIVDSLLIEADGEINLTGRGYRGGNSSNHLDTPSDTGESFNDDGLGGYGGVSCGQFGTIGGGGGGYMTVGQSAKPNTYSGQWNFGGDYAGKGGDCYTWDNHNFSTVETYMRMGAGGGCILFLFLRFLFLSFSVFVSLHS
jgi:hypothetical protein